MKTTLQQIRMRNPCAHGFKKLLKFLGPGFDDVAPIDILTVLESNGLHDAIWCLCAVEGFDREQRLFAVWCARRVEHLSTDPRVKQCNDVAERFANNLATKLELDTAKCAALAVSQAMAESWMSECDGDAWKAARSAINAAETCSHFAYDAAFFASDAFESFTARECELEAQEAEFIRMLKEGYPEKVPA